MKLSDVVSDGPPTRTIRLKFANTADEVDVGIRLLSMKERAEAIDEAHRFARQHGIEKWDRDNPTCGLGMWLAIVSRAAFSVSEGVDVPFATADQLLEHPLLGQENLAFLYDQCEEFEESLNIRTKKLGQTEVLDACLRIAQDDSDFLASLRPGIAKALLHILAAQYVQSMMSRLQDTSDGSSPTDTFGESPNSTPTPSEIKASPTKPSE